MALTTELVEVEEPGATMRWEVGGRLILEMTMIETSRPGR